MIIHLTSDLMATSGLKAEARNAGVDVRVISQPAKVAEAIPNNQPCLLIVDLQTNNLDLQALMNELAGSNSLVEVLAYAQHVRTELLDSAKKAGIENLMTRGQFSQAIPDLVRKHVG